MDYMKKIEGPSVVFSSNFFNTIKQMFIGAFVDEPGGMWFKYGDRGVC
jgi:hypothetical protein